SRCPAEGAIVGMRRKIHYIIDDRCIGCGTCVDACPQKAISLSIPVEEATAPEDGTVQGVFAGGVFSSWNRGKALFRSK
ncbi:MAG TPA: 4Fe-4S binding protein, partial [Candidatus Hydrogenedentes bacterium]|nr:4Fe-4S binding protein [Candidatus Hydrogenedentota bacterium]